MRRYKVSFEIERPVTWDDSSREFKSLHDMRGKDYDIRVPVHAKIEEVAIPEQFEPGYFRCTDDIGHSYEGDVVFWNMPPQKGFWESVEVTPKPKRVYTSEPVFRVGDKVEVKHTFVYDPNGGRTGTVTLIEDRVDRKYRVEFFNKWGMDSYSFYNAIQLTLVIG